MLDLNSIKIVVEKSLLEYICDMYKQDGFVTFISVDDEVFDIDTEAVSANKYRSLEHLSESQELEFDMAEFVPVENEVLSKYFKLVCES